MLSFVYFYIFIFLDKAQATKITGYLEGRYSVQISTVDAFQGAERDIIILSTSRTIRLGFSDSPKRLNVAITRARRHLIVMGSAPLLTSNSAWDTVLNTALSSSGGLQSCSRIISTGELELTSQPIPEQNCDMTKNDIPKKKSSAVVVVPATKVLRSENVAQQRHLEYNKSIDCNDNDDDDGDDFLNDLNIDELFN